MTRKLTALITVLLTAFIVTNAHADSNKLANILAAQADEVRARYQIATLKKHSISLALSPA